MKLTMKPSTQRITTRSLALFGVAALFAVIAALPAQADHRHRSRHGHHDRGHHAGHGRHGSHPVFGHDHPRHRVDIRHRGIRDSRRYTSFVIPQRIYARDHHVFSRHHQGRIFYAPHRHHHAVYDFPVYTRYGYVYRPHYYCDGALFLGGQVSFGNRNFRVHVDF